MGNGSTLVLFNGTQHDWTLGTTSSYQMNSWDGHFPKYITPGQIIHTLMMALANLLSGTAAFVYFEYDQFGKTRTDTQAMATYSSDSFSFKVTAKDHPERVSVEMTGVKTQENPSGTRCEQQLTWMHNGWTSFQIISKNNTDMYLTNFPSPDWMQKNLDWLGSRPLHALCIPGSHNAGMHYISQVYAHDIPAIRDFMGPLCQCQKGSVAEQLQWGSRYFDIRPFISGGEYWTGHYTGTLGARGQSIPKIVDDVNQFTSRFNELVILDISHVTNSDEKSGKGWRESFNAKEWTALFDILSKLNHRFILTDGRQENLSRLTLSDFIGSGKAAVLIIVNGTDAATLGKYANQGFFLPNQLQIFDNYSDTPLVDVMSGKQLQQMRDFMHISDPGIYLLSWTLTQHVDQIVQTIGNTLMPIKGASNVSIEGLADQANRALLMTLIPNVSDKAFPNIIYLDFLHGTNLFTGAALVVNTNVKV